jgi:hypothetical protein
MALGFRFLFQLNFTTRYARLMEPGLRTPSNVVLVNFWYMRDEEGPRVAAGSNKPVGLTTVFCKVLIELVACFHALFMSFGCEATQQCKFV